MAASTAASARDNYVPGRLCSGIAARAVARRAGPLRAGRFEADFPDALHAQRHRRSRIAAIAGSCSPIPRRVKKEVRVSSAVNAVFEIPPGEDDFAVKARYIFKDDTLLLTLMPHMHLRGKAFRYEVTYPDGKNEVLLDVPRYDFGWQTSYRLTEPKLMPRGTRMDCFAEFDNSEDNLNNPDPKVAGSLRRPDVRGNDDRVLRSDARPTKIGRIRARRSSR